MWFFWTNRLSALSNTVFDPFRLRIYKSTELLTLRVQAEQLTFGLVLALMLFIDTWAWSRAWNYGLGGFWLPLVLGLVFGCAAVLFDRSLIVADTTVNRLNGWYTIGGRALLLILVSFLTAVPTELAVFEAEITAKLEKIEKTAADNIRQEAIKVETERFDKRVAEVNAQLSSDASATVANAEQDIVRFQGDRTRERSQLVEVQTTKRQSLEKTLSEKSEQVALEAAGKGPSGRYGKGPALEAMQQQENTARQALDNFESESAKHIADFDTETQDRLKQLRATRDTAVANGQSNAAKELNIKRQEKDKKIEELRLMAPDKLSALYGGNYKEAKGFLARFHALSEMSDADKYVNAIVWGCRIAMVLLGIFVLGLKMMASQEFKLYYSAAAQAKVGDEGATAAVNNMGYTDHEQYGNTAQVRELLFKLHAARQATWQALWDLDKKIPSLATPSAMTNLCSTRAKIEGELHGTWLDKGSIAMAAVNDLEEQLRLLGVTAPAWPEKLGSDPRGSNEEPWKVTEDKLKTFGWQRPDEKLEEVGAAKTGLVSERRKLRKLIASTDFDLHQLIGVNPTMTKRDMEAVRRNAYEISFVPILDKMVDYEFTIREAGQQPPAWPVEFADPRPNLFEKLCKLDERTLRDKYGWQGMAAPSAEA